MKARFLIPLGVFLVLMGLLYFGLGQDPRDVPSVLIDTKAPEFSLPDLLDPQKTVNSASMQGQVWLLNVWGTWCAECWREHEYLIHLTKTEGIPIVSIDWRDDPEEARKFLERKGNPFIAVGFDPESKVIMDFGVYGAPETFLIDKQGFIRLKHTGALTPEVWDKLFKPKIQGLEKAQ